MECCGTPFGIGDRVEWSAEPWTLPLPTVTGINTIDYLYDAHSSKKLAALQGCVEEIWAVYQMYQLDPAKKVSIPVQGKRVRLYKKADGREAKLKDKNYIFSAYFVVLSPLLV